MRDNLDFFFFCFAIDSLDFHDHNRRLDCNNLQQLTTRNSFILNIFLESIDVKWFYWNFNARYTTCWSNRWHWAVEVDERLVPNKWCKTWLKTYSNFTFEIQFTQISTSNRSLGWKPENFSTNVVFMLHLVTSDREIARVRNLSVLFCGDCLLMNFKLKRLWDFKARTQINEKMGVAQLYYTNLELYVYLPRIVFEPLENT